MDCINKLKITDKDKENPLDARKIFGDEYVDSIFQKIKEMATKSTTEDDD